MGESKLKRVKHEEMLMSCAGVETAGGRVQVRIVGYGPVAATGALIVTPPVSVGYSLLASNGAGTAVAAASITVNPLPRGQILASSADAEFHTAFDGSLLERHLLSQLQGKHPKR